MAAIDLLIRPATAGDIPSMRAILAAHDEDGPVAAVDIVGPYLRHLVEHATAAVAVRAGAVVGFGTALDAGVARHLADLFVRPDLLGRGIGRRLLEAVMGDAPRRTTFASTDPRALPLYVRAGMTPFWPSLLLEGAAVLLAAPEPSMAVEPADPLRLAALERAWTGADRRSDHAFWASQPGADPFVVLEGGEPVAFAYARARQVGPARAIDRLVVRPDAEPVRPTLAAIRHGARGGPVVAHVLGPSPVLPALLAARFRILDREQFLASDAGLVDPARLVPDPGML